MSEETSSPQDEPVEEAAAQAAPGWYPDPTAPSTQRYWDGSAWAPPQQPMYTLQPAKYTPPNGNTTLVVAILGLVVCPFLGFWSFFSSKKDREEAARLGLQPDGTVTASYIISIIAMVYSVFWLLIVVFMFLPLLFLPFIAAGS